MHKELWKKAKLVLVFRLIVTVPMILQLIINHILDLP